MIALGGLGCGSESDPCSRDAEPGSPDASTAGIESDTSGAPGAGASLGRLPSDPSASGHCGDPLTPRLAITPFGADDPPAGEDGPFYYWRGTQGLLMIGFNLRATGVPDRAEHLDIRILRARDGLELGFARLPRRPFLCASDHRFLPQLTVILESGLGEEDLAGERARMAVSATFALPPGPCATLRLEAASDYALLVREP